MVGDTVNVAARLQSAARPGSVTVGERTMRASSGAVRYEQLEPLELKGKSEPVPAWEAVAVRAQQAVGRGAPGARGAAGRPRRRSCPRSTTIFERVELERAPHLVTLVGEAGVGKSRVLRELESQLCGRPIAPDVPHRPLPALRQRDRVLGARRGAARGVRHRRHRLRRGGLVQAARLRARPVRRQGRRRWARRPSARPR